MARLRCEAGARNQCWHSATKLLQPGQPHQRQKECERCMVLGSQHDCSAEKQIFSDLNLFLLGKVEFLKGHHGSPTKQSKNNIMNVPSPHLSHSWTNMNPTKKFRHSMFRVPKGHQRSPIPLSEAAYEQHFKMENLCAKPPPIP